MNREEFIKSVKELGIDLNEDMINKLDRFYHLLIEWNAKINLTTIVKEEDVYLKHFYDSLTLFKEVDLTKDLYLCDVGTGAGFPGIVLKIVFPQLKIVLIDSLQKRITYLNEIIKELDLHDIEAIHTRMEDYSKINEEKFDIITARAVANVKVLSEICVRALKLNGRLVFMKANIDDEFDNLDNMIRELNLSKVKINKFLLPVEDSNRALVSFTKLSKTKDKYPRNIDKIKKNAL
jgi:16S rRNA (guanine527-N7)-methyltransferase